jgi:hypothetical protein
MNLIKITPGAPATFDVDLSGRRYTLTFVFNSRIGYWTVDLDLAGVSLVTGQACVMGVELFRGHADPRIPRALYFAPIDSNTEDAGFSELGARVILVEIQKEDGLDVVSI